MRRATPAAKPQALKSDAERLTPAEQLDRFRQVIERLPEAEPSEAPAVQLDPFNTATRELETAAASRRLRLVAEKPTRC